MLRAAVLIASLALAFVPSRSAGTRPAAKVWVVATTLGPGVDFVNLQSAVDASASGDAVLVKPGAYLSFTIDGKGISVVADGAVALSNGPVKVQNVPATESALVAGILAEGFSLVDDAGKVFLEDCDTFPQTGIQVSGCAAATLVRCTGHATFKASNSRVHAFECQFFGGPLNNAFGGLIQLGSFLVASHCTFTGAMGAPASCVSFPFPCICSPGGPGGVGLVIIDNSRVYQVESSAMGGPGGSPVTPCCANPGGSCSGGTFGQNMWGSWTTLAPSARTLLASPIAREGSVWKLQLVAAPSELLFLFHSDSQDPTFLPAWAGTYVPTLPWGVTAIANAPNPQGIVEFDIPIPDLVPVMQGIVVYAQFVAADPSLNGPNYLSTPRAVLLLDASIP